MFPAPLLALFAANANMFLVQPPWPRDPSYRPMCEHLSIEQKRPHHRVVKELPRDPTLPEGPLV